jgi:hypothetical protein
MGHHLRDLVADAATAVAAGQAQHVEEVAGQHQLDAPGVGAQLVDQGAQLVGGLEDVAP